MTKDHEKWCVFYSKWWPRKILRLLQFSIKYEIDIRNLLRTTKLKDCTDRLLKKWISEVLALNLFRLALFFTFFDFPLEIVKGNSAKKSHKNDKKNHFLKSSQIIVSMQNHMTDLSIMISFTSFQGYYVNLGPVATEKISRVHMLHFTYFSNIS